MYEAKALTNCATSAALVLFCVPLKTLKIFINIRITSVGEGLPNLDLYVLRRLNGLFDKPARDFDDPYGKIFMVHSEFKV